MIAKRFRLVVDGNFHATGIDDALRRLALHFAEVASDGSKENDSNTVANFIGEITIHELATDDLTYELGPILPEAIAAEVAREPEPELPTATPRIITGTRLNADQLNSLGLLGWLLPGEYDVTGSIDGDAVVLRLSRPVKAI